MFNFLKKLHKEKEKEIYHFEKYRPIFTTTDGAKHIGTTYNWGNESNLLCTVPEYIMIEIKEKEYIFDECKEMFLLKNIKSIKWELVDEKFVVKPALEKFCIFYSDEDLKRFEIWENKEITNGK